MTVVILKDVRLQWSAVHEPDADRTDEKTGQPIKGKYSVTALFTPGSDADKAARAAFQAAAAEEFGANHGTILEAMSPDKKCLRNGNRRLDKDGAVKEEFKDMLYLVARNKVKPVVVGPRGPSDILTADSGKPYRGCYANIKVDISGWKAPAAQGGNQVNARLLAVQFVRDGEGFGGATPTADGFDAVPGSESDDPFAV